VLITYFVDRQTSRHKDIIQKNIFLITFTKKIIIISKTKY